MPKKTAKFLRAMKHGGYSNTTLLPNEDGKAFKILHDDLHDDLLPSGPLEEDAVLSIARFVWRKQNMSVYRAESNKRIRFTLNIFDKRLPGEIEAANEARDKQPLKVVVPNAEASTEMGELVTIERLVKELELIDRLDSLIDRALKRLLMIRGVKSISASPLPNGAQSRRTLPAA
jgi:hypothetical protein